MPLGVVTANVSWLTPLKWFTKRSTARNVAHAAVPHLVTLLSELRGIVRALVTEIDKKALVDRPWIGPATEAAGDFASITAERAAAKLDRVADQPPGIGKQGIGEAPDIPDCLGISPGLYPAPGIKWGGARGGVLPAQHIGAGRVIPGEILARPAAYPEWLISEERCIDGRDLQRGKKSGSNQGPAKTRVS